MKRSAEHIGPELVGLLPRLRRFARALTGNVHDADDLVQLALERALAHATQLRADAPLAAWVFGILRNAWLDQSRARSRGARVLVSQADTEAIADPAADAHADVLAVQEAVARLPPEQREVVGLVLIEGFSYREAAEVLGVPMGTVTSRLARARDALQAVLAGADRGSHEDR